MSGDTGQRSYSETGTLDPSESTVYSSLTTVMENALERTDALAAVRRFSGDSTRSARSRRTL
ncbi:hypothetical protein C491_18759 [Natronococcus amylolyticus DSM 10524]|uniref:Uncharacterized protein n=1 Tax=Natronococcus amylolyticus DSM 10524 TaxID=1227497 RepID=L9WZ41_9EURY|nr:hypothetical protein C491_18759 [Natronococcus amylolyticus DSM 10524]